MNKNNLLYALVATVLGDVFITVPFFHYEANPVVASMGPTVFVVSKLLIVGAIVVAWEWGMKEYRVFQAWAGLMALFHGIVVASNAMVVTGVL